MGKPLRDAWLTVRELVTAAGPLLLLALALLGLAYHWLDPNPPREITVATGPAQSAYDEFGQRYAAALAAHGIRCICAPRKAQRKICNGCAKAKWTWALCKVAAPHRPKTALPCCRWAACL